MTNRIPKSLVADREKFAAMVTAHIAELDAWTRHHEALEQDRPRMDALASKPADQRTEEDKAALMNRRSPYPVPTTDPRVAASVRHQLADGKSIYAADYEIFDDAPPPPPPPPVVSPERRLRISKDALIRRVVEAEYAAVVAVIPVGKRKYRAILYQDIRTADLAAVRELAAADNEERAKALAAENEASHRAAAARMAASNAKIVFDRAQDEVANAITRAEKADSAKKAADAADAVTTTEEKAAADEKAFADVVEQRKPQRGEAELLEAARKQRSKDSAAFAADQEMRTAMVDQIARLSAKAQHDVEDLTDEAAIEAFEVPQFPKPVTPA